MMKAIEPSLIKDNFIEIIGKEWMLVSAGDKTKFNTMTASWGGVGFLWNKPVVFVFIRPERYEALVPWFAVDTLHLRKLNVNTLPPADLLRHPYLNYQQVQILLRLRKQKSRLSGWENLLLLEEFSDIDRERLTPYLSFAPPS